MFVKLFKYDFRSTWGTLGVLSLIALGAGAAGSGLLRYFDHGTHGDFLEVMGFTAMMTVMIYLIAYSLASMFILLGRFYKSRFTDEGYLTFTLPVTTHQVLLSSFLNCFLGLLLALFVTVVAFAIFLFFGLPSLDGERMDFIRLCFQKLPEAIQALGGLRTVLTFLLALLAAVACEILTIMLAITIGSVLAKKHKILAAIGVYYGLHILLSLASVFVSITASQSGVAQGVLLSGAASFFGISAGYAVAVGLICYVVMYILTHKKLNLN